MAIVRLPKPQPIDPPFLVAMLIGARKTGDTMMEYLARQWLDEQGIEIRFAKSVSRPKAKLPEVKE
jgi:hypothetical protein